MRKAEKLPQSCAVVTESGKLYFLKITGPLQNCNGFALHLPYINRLLTQDSVVQTAKFVAYVVGGAKFDRQL